jgi:hypothetical protein
MIVNGVEESGNDRFIILSVHNILEGLKKITVIIIIGLRAEIRTPDLPNVKHECSPLNVNERFAGCIPL